MESENHREADHDMITEMAKDVKDLLRLVKGNGQPGLLQRVTSLEQWRAMLIGGYALVVFSITIYAALKR